MKMQSITDLKQAIEIQIQKRKSAERHPPSISQPLLYQVSYLTSIFFLRQEYRALHN